MQTELFSPATLSFADFWQVYPRKTAKQPSQKAWLKLNIKDQMKAIKDCIPRYKDTPKQFIPHASTYLNQERWDEEIITEESKPEYSTPMTQSQAYKAFVPVEQGNVSHAGRDALKRILGR